MNFLKKIYILVISFCLTMMWSCSSESHENEHHDHDHEHEYEHETHDHDNESHEHEHQEETDHHEEAEIKIDPAQVKKFGIETEEVQPGLFREIIKTGGMIEPSSSDIYTITARKSGIVTLAGGIAPGSSVAPGSKVATVSSDGIQGGDPSKAAAANLAVAKAEYDRLKPLFEDKLVTEATFREAERTYNEAKALAGLNTTAGTITLSSPQGGTITNLYVTTGQYVDTGDPVATITKSSRMTLRADLPARYSSRLTSIESANFIPEGTKNALVLKEMDGRMLSGSAGINSVGGYLPLYFTFSGDPIKSPAGYATVFLLGAPKEGVISVPRTALLELQGNKYVYVVHDENKYEKRLVSTGADDGSRIEITSGIIPGEIIVSKGASIVRMAEVSAIAPPAHTHNH